MGYKNVMWGSDYPHIEGTFGHTQKTLHELFDDVPGEVRERVTRGALRNCSRTSRILPPPNGELSLLLVPLRHKALSIGTRHVSYR